MALTESQKREVWQLILVAREYLRLGDPEHASGVGMSANKNTFMRGPISPVAWSEVMKAAHLASAAIRLASIDEVLKRAGKGRPLYGECRAYFQKDSSGDDDPRGTSCSEWLHVMLRDSIAHNEPLEGVPGKHTQRYEARQRCIEATLVGEAYARLRQTEEDLVAVIASLGIVLPVVES